jgi:predicted Zn finger-like uncharacterized protein
MIIQCKNCNKEFKVDSNLIPESGRSIQCGSCNHVWFYKKEIKSPEPLTLNDIIEEDKIEKNIFENKDDKNLNKTIKKERPQTTKITNQTGSKFFSYLIVFVITFLSLIILIDTLKTPLIKIFPALELILFNLFETLNDIKLIIIDLY